MSMSSNKDSPSAYLIKMIISDIWSGKSLYKRARIEIFFYKINIIFFLTSLLIILLPLTGSRPLGWEPLDNLYFQKVYGVNGE